MSSVFCLRRRFLVLFSYSVFVFRHLVRYRPLSANVSVVQESFMVVKLLEVEDIYGYDEFAVRLVSPVLPG